VPARTTLPLALRPEDFSRICAAPQVITPGSVQPGMGNGRSSAPVARMMWRAVSRREPPPTEMPISRSRETLQTVAAGT
jgi:hypothetical protein